MSLYNFSWVLLHVLGKQYFEIISTYVLCANEILYIYIGGCEWPKDAKHVTELVELGCTLIVTGDNLDQKACSWSRFGGVTPRTRFFEFRGVSLTPRKGIFAFCEVTPRNGFF